MVPKRLLKHVVARSGIVLCGVILIGTHGCQKSGTTAAVDDSKATAAGKASVADVIKGNSEIIDELGRAAAMMTKSTDIIMRYSHYADGHTNPVLMCPECAQHEHQHDEPEIDDPEEDIPETMDQLLKDSQEVRRSVAGFTMGLKLQHTALQRHLDHLRAASADESP